MQNQAALAYQQTARQTASPRELEASLLSRSASQLERIRENWDFDFETLDSALTFNRKIWSVFLSSVTREDSPLPQPIRQNIANLGIFVMNHTLDIMAAPQPAKLTALISINREIAAGLRAR